ncbi:STAG-domain-containing protein [Setomelanomma holmii]|uniref:STAG-domain-containing protein n=1 Tax=Setomelanomma holmii TaxID=210430 RepID=A0A9P4H148_9PLEO|nr:STAG-domain-containing protein [Setomelanomma holmii]
MSTAVLTSEVSDAATSTARRRSGRVSKKPAKFALATSPAGSTKRKRGDNDDSGVETDEPTDEEPESSDGEPDEEEVRERQRKRKGKGPAKKTAPKRPRTNGATVSLAMRPATGASKLAKRPRKAAIRKSAMSADEPEGLYADVFARGDRLGDVAARWVARFNEHEARAVAEVINLVLRAAGCDIRIDEDDIADPDNAPSRVAEIQEEFQTHEVTDYPLIAKAKDGGGQAFRNALHGFFVALVQTVAQSGLLYENQDLLENISVWLGAMSSTGNRPFRHTSTVASLAITTALASVASDLVENAAKRQRQSEAESKKSRVNKARVSAADKEADEYAQKLHIIDSALGDWFSVVYVHRYRDIDPRIRVDCVIALADWIIMYPDRFFDGTHLRYLGWVLSDSHAPTRVEVLHQLARLFRDKDKLAGLKTFTERFRPRIVEIATHDAEDHVRATAVDLLDVLREAGFLEPDDIDSVGKLIFDSHTKVRKAVVGFFAENVSAAYEAIVEDMGGEDALNEALAPSDEDEEEYHNPRLEWLKLKCLVEQLLAYEDGSLLPSQNQGIAPSGAEIGLKEAGVESRFSLAAQALYDAIPEIQSWEVLAGYLLYDHSQPTRNGSSDDAETMLRQNSQLEERHETVLLDILNAAVRLRLQRLAEAQKDKKKTKVQRESDKEDQADMARRLSLLVPQLLKKFGALPEAAALCLRLEQELNLDVFQELRQNAALTALLDDINKQFLTHHNEGVLREAIKSILHAQGNEELKETVALKVQALWDDIINTFDALRRGKDFSIRGNLDHNILTGVSNVVSKMAQLGKASDASVLDKISIPAKTKGKGKKTTLDTPPIDSVLEILNRGVPEESLDAETEQAEDALVRHSMALMLAYFVWKNRDCAVHLEEGTSMPDDELTAIVERRDACVDALMKIMESRKGADDVRLNAANLLLELYNMFRSLKNRKNTTSKTPKKPQSRSQSDNNDDWEALCRIIDGKTAKTLLHILTASENRLAKLLHKKLEEPDVDDDPIDPDDEPESDDDDDDDDEQLRDDKQLRTIIAERSLLGLGAHLVHAVHVGSFDNQGQSVVRKRLEHNKLRLTPTWKEIVNHLDAVKQARKGTKADLKAPTEISKSTKSKDIVIEDDSDEEEGLPGDEIEDEEMADGHEEPVNGEEKTRENGDADAEDESIVGD